MATIITSECINCGACEPECPNTAIYQGGVEWEQDGKTHPALSDEIFYIVPEKCTECVGFYDQEACAAVCPVDCCVPDPNRPESEEALLVRAKELHPEATFAAEFPSRFRKAAGEPAAAAPAAAPTNGGAAAAPGPARATAAAPAPAVGGRVERPLPRQHPVALAPAPAPRGPKQFPGELHEDFDAVLAAVLVGASRGGRLIRWFINLAQPILGAASDQPKRRLERIVSDRRVFSAARATVRNGMLNMVLYPSLLAAMGVVAGGREFFSAQMKSLIFLGVSVAAVEWMVRMRESVFRGVPPGEAPLRGSLYTPIGNVLLRPFLTVRGTESRQSQVAFDGFYDARFDDKTERERRYGEVYRVEDLSGGYFLRLEFPTRIPPSSLGHELGLPEHMPDYDYDIALQNGHLVVSGKVVDPRVLKLTAVAGAFPPEFTTRVALGRPVAGFRHRYRDKVLEVALPTRR